MIAQTMIAPETPCTIDLSERRNIIKYLRDLINMGPMLDININEEIHKFMRKSQEAGWAQEILDSCLEQACNFTIYEQHLERPMRERGDYWKYTWMKKITKTYNDEDWKMFKRKGAWAG